jgi:hypothetical protein
MNEARAVHTFPGSRLGTWGTQICWTSEVGWYEVVHYWMRSKRKPASRRAWLMAVM